VKASPDEVGCVHLYNCHLLWNQRNVRACEAASISLEHDTHQCRPHRKTKLEKLSVAFSLSAISVRSWRTRCSLFLERRRTCLRHLAHRLLQLGLPVMSFSLQAAPSHLHSLCDYVDCIAPVSSLHLNSFISFDPVMLWIIKLHLTSTRFCISVPDPVAFGHESVQ